MESGAVRLIRYGRAGEEVVLHDARAGEFFAEASLDSARYHCDAVASTPSELLQVPAAALRDLLDADREFARQWVALLARQLRAVRTRVERLSPKGAAERVRHLLVSEGRGPHCEVLLAGALKDLARNLGLTHEVLYRTIAAMERDGVIERKGTTLLDRVRKRRLWPTQLTQSMQLTVQDNVLVPVIGADAGAELHVPLPMRVLTVVPALQRLFGRLLAMGVRPEHVRSPAA